MKRQKRHFLFVAIAIATTVSCSKEMQPGISVDESFTPLVRSDSTIVAGIDLERLRATPLYQKLKDRLDLSVLDQFSEQFGLDPRKDLNRLLFVSDGKKDYFLANGGFKNDTVKQKIQTLGLRTSSYKGTDVIGDGQKSFALLKGPVALAGNAEGVHKALDTHDDGVGSIPTEIVDRLRALPKDDQIWAVSRDGLPFLNSIIRTDVQSALANIVNFVAVASAGIGVANDLDLQATLACFSVEGAARVNDALRGTVAIGRLSTKDGETSLLKMYDSVQITRRDNTVDVRVHLTEQQAEELLNRLSKRKA